MLIFASVNPADVPNVELLKISPEDEVSVGVFDSLSKNTHWCEPLTLNSVPFPLVSNPNPNNCASADELTIVEPAATDVYVIPYAEL